MKPRSWKAWGLVWGICAGVGLAYGSTHPVEAEPTPTEPAYSRIVFEDGSWVTSDGLTGCIPGMACDDTVPEVAPTCVDEYESTDCYYTQGEDTWYVDAEGEAHLVTE